EVTVDVKKAVTPAEQKGTGLTRFGDIEREFEDLFDNFMSRNWMRPFRWDVSALRSAEARLPKVDVVERDGEILVRAELPGVEKKDLDISLTDRTVTIKASTRTESKEEKGDYFRQEISTGQVSRTVTLPTEVDGEKATAEFKDGLLEITVPKTSKAGRIRVDVK
ncbi:MAG TPA: Hsp20/alpha crystallin family protein, partial [Pseudomonadales bacterium]